MRVEQCFAQQVQVAVPVGVIQEAGQAVVAALDDVLRDTGQVESRESGYAPSIGRWPGRR
jgi:hypothetical protein